MILESESIEVFREAVACASNPVMMYSMGKDSSVMLHLARKAFFPALPPFPLLHVDTGWKFQAMYTHRDRVVAESGMTLIVHTNPEGVAARINPFTHGSNFHTDVMKTQALKQALDEHGLDVHSATAGIPKRSGQNSGTCTTRTFVREKLSASSP